MTSKPSWVADTSHLTLNIVDQENLQVEVDNVDPTDVGSYTLTLDQYMSTSSWSIDFCEIDPVPVDILLPTS